MPYSSAAPFNIVTCRAKLLQTPSAVGSPSRVDGAHAATTHMLSDSCISLYLRIRRGVEAPLSPPLPPTSLSEALADMALRPLRPASMKHSVEATLSLQFRCRGLDTAMASSPALRPTPSPSGSYQAPSAITVSLLWGSRLVHAQFGARFLTRSSQRGRKSKAPNEGVVDSERAALDASEVRRPEARAFSVMRKEHGDTWQRSAKRAVTEFPISPTVAASQTVEGVMLRLRGAIPIAWWSRPST